ncbi:hypothetical protein N7G274_000998 [Stereocaulon virgatum]|uniref:Rhodopsin domain-containing protein n=1 Tax=Stereocaulon virgatum TaxID=373712 RepID=A0ABR4AP09_9LECA
MMKDSLLTSQQTSFWTSYGVVNMFTEVALIGLPVFAIWKVRITKSKKLVVMSCFALRVTIIGAVIAQLDLLNKLRGSKDITFDSWSYAISTQIVQNLSVITVCIPYVRNVLVGLESGLLQTGAFHLHKISGTTTDNSTSHTNATSKGTENHGPVGRHEDTESLGALGRDASNVGPFHSNNIATIGANPPTEEWDAESQSSRAKIIKQITEWTVDRQ